LKSSPSGRTTPPKKSSGLVTLPLELEMNGVPHMVVMRSISLYGLSDLILTFEDSTDDYFARQIVFERLAQATLPTGVTPTWRPCSARAAWFIATCWKVPTAAPQELKDVRRLGG
jgi:cobalt-zinc-cadmium resistance protein CzcA